MSDNKFLVLAAICFINAFGIADVADQMALPYMEKVAAGFFGLSIGLVIMPLYMKATKNKGE